LCNCSIPLFGGIVAFVVVVTIRVCVAIGVCVTIGVCVAIRVCVAIPDASARIVNTAQIAVAVCGIVGGLPFSLEAITTFTLAT